MIMAFLLATTAAVAAPMNNPNGPTYCAEDGSRVWWAWRADENPGNQWNIRLVRNGKAELAMSSFSWMPRQRPADFYMAILPEGKPGKELILYVDSRLYDFETAQDYRLCACSGKPCSASDLRTK